MNMGEPVADSIILEWIEELPLQIDPREKAKQRMRRNRCLAGVHGTRMIELKGS